MCVGMVVVLMGVCVRVCVRRRHRQRVEDELGAAGGGRRLAGRARGGARARRPRRPQPGRPARRARAHPARLAASHTQGTRSVPRPTLQYLSIPRTNTILHQYYTTVLLPMSQYPTLLISTAPYSLVLGPTLQYFSLCHSTPPYS